MNDKELYWKVLESEYLFREPWFTARRDKCLLPNGNVMDAYYVLEYPDWINTIAITKDNEFVFVRQYRHALGSVNFELCAGVVENGEPPMEAAKRELWEETGYAGGEWEEFMTIAPNPSSSTNHTHCFIARGVEKVDEQHLEPTEMITVHLFTYDEVLEMLKQGKIQQATMLAPLWKFVAGKLA
ncbi:MAG: NUDIX hydrolase [Paludibacter sp.]|jgi:ADP-ribose pyrophosphatase|nr:NUDIX hydrolase [Paludibacter sp.]